VDAPGRTRSTRGCVGGVVSLLTLATGTALYSGNDLGTAMNPTTGLPANEQVEPPTF